MRHSANRAIVIPYNLKLWYNKICHLTIFQFTGIHETILPPIQKFSFSWSETLYLSNDSFPLFSFQPWKLPLFFLTSQWICLFNYKWNLMVLVVCVWFIMVPFFFPRVPCGSIWCDQTFSSSSSFFCFLFFLFFFFSPWFIWRGELPYPKAYNGQHWSRLKSAARNSVHVS